jgi:hypothetical protein
VTEVSVPCPSHLGLDRLSHECREVSPSRRSGAVGQNGLVTGWQEWDEAAAMNVELPTIPDGEPPVGLWVPLARWWKPQRFEGVSTAGHAGYRT